MVGVYRAAACALVRIKVAKISRNIGGEKRRSCDNGIGGVLSSPVWFELYRQICTSDLARIVEYDSCREE